MRKIRILKRLEKWLGNKLFSSFDFVKKEWEDWEKIWPQLTIPRKLVRELVNLQKGRYRLLFSTLVLEGLIALATAAAMIAIKKFWEPFETKDWEGSLWLMVAFLALNVAQLGAGLGKNILITTLRTDLLCKLRGQLFHKLLLFPLGFYKKMETGSLIGHINRDVGLVVDMVTTFFISGIGTICSLASVGAVVFWLNWKVGVLIFLVFLLFSPLVQITRAVVGRYAKRVFALHSRLLSLLQQSLYALKYLKAMGFEQRESLRINRILEEHRQLNLKVAVVHQTLGPVMEFCYLLLICGGIWMGMMFFREEIKVSLIVPLVYALFRILKPVRQLINSLIRLEENLQAARRVFGTLTAEEKKEERKKGIPIRKPIISVKLSKVSYGYDNNWDLLTGVNVELRRGEMAALMGESGVGKSTLCELIMGLYPDYQGKILINGQELRQLNPKSYRRLLGYVPQESLIIRGTIRENLLYGSKDEIKEAELITALRRAHAWEFVKQLEGGLDAELGERGINLSGGECQRLCLARALFRNPQVLILDEATSSLDLENEAKILQALQELKGEMVILLVSHRFSILKFADRAVLMEEGKVRELENRERHILTSEGSEAINRISFLI